MTAFGGIGFCCCDSCGTHTALFASDHDAGEITPTGTASWTIDGGEAEYAGPDPLVYVVPVESRTSPLVVKIVAKAVNASTAGITIYIVVNGVTVSLTVDADTDDVTLAFGDFSEVVGEWTADGEDLSLQITATECLTWIRWEIGDLVGQESTTQVEFDPYETEYVMGVIGEAGPALTGCEALTLSLTGDTDPFEDGGSCELDPRTVTTSGTTAGRSTSALCYFGGDDPAFYWLTDLENVLNVSDGIFDGLQLLIWCDGTTLNAAVLGADGCENSLGITIQNLTWDNATGTGRFEVYTNRTECSDEEGVTLWVDVQAQLSGDGGTRVDDVRLTACGEAPTKDCGRPDGNCGCPDGEVFPCITVETTIGFGTYSGSWVGLPFCDWFASPTSGASSTFFRVGPEGGVEFHILGEVVVFARDEGQADPSCMDVSGTYTATNGSGHTATITMEC